MRWNQAGEELRLVSQDALKQKRAWHALGTDGRSTVSGEDRGGQGTGLQGCRDHGFYPKFSGKSLLLSRSDVIQFTLKNRTGCRMKTREEASDISKF